MTVHVYVYTNTDTGIWFESLVVCEGGPWELTREYDKEIPDPGGGGGTTNYNQLINQPQVNGVTLVGNKTAEMLSLVDQSTIGKLADLTTTIKASIVAAINEHDKEIGDLATLKTTVKDNVVGAINEHDIEIGDLATLTTTVKSALVLAINELDGEMGVLSMLTTAAKNTVVAAINELDKEIGGLTTLKTQAKTSLVAALNELHDNVLEKDNTTAFTPDSDYEPATKKYADDIAALVAANLATVEKTTKASKSYTVGTHLVYVNKLYRVKTAIAAGGTITVSGTSANVEAKRVDEVIAELNAKDSAQDAEIAAVANVGAKNLLKPNLTTRTLNGITFTLNDDGSVTLNGTATTNASINNGYVAYLKAGTYKVSGAPSASTGAFLRLASGETGATYIASVNDEYTLTVAQDGYYTVGPFVNNGRTVNNLTCYPMIRDASITDDTYVPYRMDIAMLTEAVKPIDYLINSGAKNRLKLTGLAQETKNGITCTINTDGMVTVDGTATADAYFFIVTNTKDSAWNFGSDYVMTGCPNGGSANTYGLAYRVGRDSDDQMVRTDWDYGSGVALGGFNATSQRVRVMVFVKSGQTVSNLVFSPMVRLAAITDDTYVPYGKTNAEITAELSDTGWALLEGSANQHIRNGLFYRRKNGVGFLYIGGPIDVALTANVAAAVGTLPAGFRPSSRPVQGAIELNNALGLVVVAANGEISIKGYTAVPANSVARGGISFPV